LAWGAVAAAGPWTAGAVYLAEISLRLPRKSTHADGWRNVPPDSVEITTADGLKMRGWFFRAPRPGGGAVIALHGQTDNRGGALGFADFFLRHGYSVLTPDSRAHGSSDGDLTTYGFRESDDVHRWVGWLAARLPGERIFGLGESMGAAILLQTLAVEPRFCAVVAEAPYSSLREIAYDRLAHEHSGPERYAVRPILETAILYQRLRYDVDLRQVSPENAVAQSSTPVLLIYGSKDDNTPSHHAQRIHGSNPATVTLWEVPGAGHTGAWSSNPQEFERRVLGWFNPANCR